MLVGGYADNDVDLCGEGNADAKRLCLGKGQTMLTKQPNQAEFEECWSETIIKFGLSPSVVDDPLFRKVLVTTDRMGQSVVSMGKGINRFRVITESLSANEQIPGGTEPKKYGEIRYGSRVTMNDRSLSPCAEGEFG